MVAVVDVKVKVTRLVEMETQDQVVVEEVLILHGYQTQEQLLLEIPILVVVEVVHQLQEHQVVDGELVVQD